jgi:F0F1-type ATP synthase assembly protein I
MSIELEGYEVGALFYLLFGALIGWFTRDYHSNGTLIFILLTMGALTLMYLRQKGPKSVQRLISLSDDDE